MNFRLCRFQGTPEYASRACLEHVFDFCEFHRKSSGWKKVLGALTRATFPTCTCERGLQNVAVANDFVQNSYSRCMILTRLPTKPMRNTHKSMLRSRKYNMPCDIIAISHLAACYSMQLYAEKHSIFIHMHAYVSVCMHAYAYVRICLRMHVHAYVCICMHMCSYVWIRMQVRVCTHMYVYVRVRMHTYSYEAHIKPI